MDGREGLHQPIHPSEPNAKRGSAHSEGSAHPEGGGHSEAGGNAEGGGASEGNRNSEAEEHFERRGLAEATDPRPESVFDDCI